MVEALLEAHSRAAFSKAAPRSPKLPDPVVFLIERAEVRTKLSMLDARAPVHGGRRRFRVGKKYQPLTPAASRATPELLAHYGDRLGDERPHHLLNFELSDAAQRIAGIGSLGVTRIAALLRSGNRQFLYDMKEARAAATLRGAEPASLKALDAAGIRTDAERVVAGGHAMLTAAPRRQRALWSGRLRLSFVARQFSPSEDRIDLDTLAAGDLAKIVATLGDVLGRAHRRGASELPARSWSDHDMRALVRRAGELTALMQGAYLASAFLERGG
jgi:uncharacterized protein (DUF2252 family)